MSSDNEDNFEDLMPQTHGDYEAMGVLTNPETKLDKSGAGMRVQFHCPECMTPRAAIISWVEIYAIAHLVNPMQLGVTDFYQANSQSPTAFGPVLPCRCGHKEAPFMISHNEARNTFLSNAMRFRADNNVRMVAAHVMRFAPRGIAHLV
jgi:hypothetical protein